jgi:hypothetical protein
VKFAGCGVSSALPQVKSGPHLFHAVSTCANAIVGFAAAASAVACDCRKPTVTIAWQPWSMRVWMLFA